MNQFIVFQATAVFHFLLRKWLVTFDTQIGIGSTAHLTYELFCFGAVRDDGIMVTLVVGTVALGALEKFTSALVLCRDFTIVTAMMPTPPLHPCGLKATAITYGFLHGDHPISICGDLHVAISPEVDNVL